MFDSLKTLYKISETFKSIAAKILESMNDHIDGSLTIIVHLALSSLYYSIESNNIIEINNKYQDLTKFVNIEFLTNTSPEIRIETSLMVLCILNYAICKRPDLM